MNKKMKNKRETTKVYPNPGNMPENLLNVPGFVSDLKNYTLRTAPYPNEVLAFSGALTMLAHLSGRNFRDSHNLRTNLYLLALADSGVGKDYPRKVNLNLATALDIMPTMADRFASAEGLEDALLIHPVSFFQVDEVDTLFAALNERKKDAAQEKIYGALLQFATSADTTYALRKKAIGQNGNKSTAFEMVRARGIHEPHLTLLGNAIPKYLYAALSERSMENGLISRTLVLEAGPRGAAGTPHIEAFPPELLGQAYSLVKRGGFEGINLMTLSSPAQLPFDDSREPTTVLDTPEAATLRMQIVAQAEANYTAADSTAEKALWSRAAEKAARLALLYAISENVNEPIISAAALNWGWTLSDFATRKMLYNASVYVHNNEFDAQRQKVIRILTEADAPMSHSELLRKMRIDSDAFRKVINTMLESEELVAEEYTRTGSLQYSLG